MARVTVEDCVTKVPNRFELVLLASQRSRALAGGITPTLERENDKNPVIALREIAEGTVNTEDLRQALIAGLQKHVEFDEPEDDSVAILAAAEKEWAGVTADDTPGKPEAAVKEAVKASDPDAGNDVDNAAAAATEDVATDDAATEVATPGVESGDVEADPKPDEV